MFLLCTFSLFLDLRNFEKNFTKVPSSCTFFLSLVFFLSELLPALNALIGAKNVEGTMRVPHPVFTSFWQTYWPTNAASPVRITPTAFGQTPEWAFHGHASGASKWQTCSAPRGSDKRTTEKWEKMEEKSAADVFHAIYRH